MAKKGQNGHFGHFWPIFRVTSPVNGSLRVTWLNSGFLKQNSDSRHIKSFQVDSAPKIFSRFFLKKEFFMRVFLAKSSHSELNRPPFEKCKILNISHHPKFVQVFLWKKTVFSMTVFLGKSSHSESMDPPLKNEKF